MDTNNTTARDVGAHTRLMVSLCNGTFTALNTEVAGVSLSEKACRMRTRLSICRKKAAYRSEEEALVAAQSSGLNLRTYQCDRCRLIHLTSRTRGKRTPRTALAT